MWLVVTMLAPRFQALDVSWKKRRGMGKAGANGSSDNGHCQRAYFIQLVSPKSTMNCIDMLSNTITVELFQLADSLFHCFAAFNCCSIHCATNQRQVSHLDTLGGSVDLVDWVAHSIGMSAATRLSPKTF